MDSVSANFFVGVFRALPIDFVREFAPHFGNSRFGLESRRFAANYRWRCLQVELLPEDAWQYRILEQRDDSDLLQPMDVAKFDHLAEVQVDCVQMFGNIPQFPSHWDPAEYGKRPSGEIVMPYRSIEWHNCALFYKKGWRPESGETEIRKVIEECAVVNCQVRIVRFREFAGWRFLEPIFDRIATLHIERVGSSSARRGGAPQIGGAGALPQSDSTGMMNASLKDLAARGKLRKIDLIRVTLNDPSVLSALFAKCSDVTVQKRGPSTWSSVKDRLIELLALMAEERLEAWSVVYDTFIENEFEAIGTFLDSNGFQKAETESFAYSKTIGKIEAKFRLSFPSAEIAVGCDFPDWCATQRKNYPFKTEKESIVKDGLKTSKRQKKGRRRR